MNGLQLVDLFVRVFVVVLRTRLKSTSHELCAEGRS
jgi:hypothetical protein